jgi:mono/diheme cytochrome c family protein
MWSTWAPSVPAVNNANLDYSARPLKVDHRNMKASDRSWQRVCAAGGILSLLGANLALVTITARDSEASILRPWRCRSGDDGPGSGGPPCAVGDIELTGEPGGTWYWMRSPEDEKRVIMGLFNRYCIRCHGVDGRGVWDIPGVPDFTNARWQSCRSDGQLARAILEGRGAVMPPFRGTLTLEEAWAMARHLRTFVPGTELPRAEITQPEKEPLPLPSTVPMKPVTPSK